MQPPLTAVNEPMACTQTEDESSSDFGIRYDKPRREEFVKARSTA